MMTEIHSEHARFDAICEQVEDYEPLPELLPESIESPLDATNGDEHSTDAIDATILAGLVSP